VIAAFSLDKKAAMTRPFCLRQMASKFASSSNLARLTRATRLM
jgi:hypothetical protein